MMRALIIAVIGSLLLGGCTAPPTGPAAAEGLRETRLPAPATDTAAEPIAEPIAAEPPPAPPPPEPPLLVQQRAACLRVGGQMMPRGGGIVSCVQPTRDGGRSCNAEAQCQGLCLARSGTCAPYQPLFGCHEVFTAPGRRETLCTD
jgi:hypothetical protein